jgi:hypothetical protein
MISILDMMNIKEIIMKNKHIVDDIIKQGKDLCDSGELSINDFNCDKVYLLAVNTHNSDLFGDVYYGNEDHILDTLIKYKAKRK